MRVLKEGYLYKRYVASDRLSRAYLLYEKVNIELNNTWFNKSRKQKLRNTLDVIGNHQDWILMKEFPNIVCSDKVKRVFGTKDKFEVFIIQEVYY